MNALSPYLDGQSVYLKTFTLRKLKHLKVDFQKQLLTVMTNINKAIYHENSSYEEKSSYFMKGFP